MCFNHLATTYGDSFHHIDDAWEAIWCTYDNKTTWRSERPLLHLHAIHPATQQRSHFANILWTSGHFKATNTHDYVYAHLGHPSARRMGGEEFVKVDYRQSLAELYLDIAKHLLAQKQGIIILSAVYHMGGLNPSQPSWVPQWHATDIRIIAPMPGDDRCWKYNASLSEQNEPGFSLTASPEGGTRLHIRGILFDTVNVCSAAHNSQSTYAAGNHPIEAAWSLAQPSNAAELLNTLGLVLVCGMCGTTGDAAEENLQEHRAVFASYCLAETTLDAAIKSAIIQIQQPLSKNEEYATVYARTLKSLCYHRRLFRTATGRFGLGPSAKRPDDICCILFGARVPFIIRRCDGAFKLVGECYI
ncbi:MAG: hypothetical protein Q9221_004575 [Calogaya cf. arnoldii]